MKKKTGKIIPHGVKPEPHELDTILYFTELGKDVELIVPSNTPHVKNADYIIDGLAWEAKSPINNNHRTIERIFYAASQKSGNLIMDLRRVKGVSSAVLKTLEKCFRTTRRVRNMMVITKDLELKKYKK